MKLESCVTATHKLNAILYGLVAIKILVSNCIKLRGFAKKVASDFLRDLGLINIIC